ncbi:hypothetical protein M0813_15639 [Anaeramoeba flamelloides]|uniref:Uncharacterized protein n=1 Tax=Anaeramoeba flamelloides TaxID=1746091 RepID=A0ABQ8Z1Q8_9EUKA|nr:hypothetical protein M0813_15639 [Anaeramoeba flamelloides]
MQHNSHQKIIHVLGEESSVDSKDQNHEEKPIHPFKENIDDDHDVDDNTGLGKDLEIHNKYFISKSGNPLPKTMRTLDKYLTENINLNGPQDIKIKLQTLVSKKLQLGIERETIKTKYFSPITWLNLFVNTNLLNALVNKNDLNQGILVHKNGYTPTKISNTLAYQEKISKFQDVDADYQIMLGFYYDDFESTSTFSLGGLYMFVDNLDYTWRLKDQTIFLIALLPGKTKINNILRQLPLLEDLQKLKNGVLLGGKKIQAQVSCFVGDTRESLPARGRLQPGGLFSCPICKLKLGTPGFINPNIRGENRHKKRNV